MDTLLVRLRPYDPRRGNVLQRFSYAGVRFREAHGWYRVELEVAEYLRGVRQRPADPHTPLAFDVCTDDEARMLDVREKESSIQRRSATDHIPVSLGRSSAGASQPLGAPASGPAG